VKRIEICECCSIEKHAHIIRSLNIPLTTLSTSMFPFQVSSK